MPSQDQTCPILAARPQYLKQALISHHLDFDIWLTSYKDEYDTIRRYNSKELAKYL